MAKFEVSIVRIRTLEPIPGADLIELAVVGDYRSVVQKGLHGGGSGFAAYIPEAALLPEPLLEAMNLTGRLAGSNKNRVKAVRLRGCLSQGILIPVSKSESGLYLTHPASGDVIAVAEGDDVADFLEITKYVPSIPAAMSGEVFSVSPELTVEYDIENIKRLPDIIADGEDVQITEKIHGTCCGITIVPQKDWDENDIVFGNTHFLVFSKGLGADGLCFKGTPENIERNIYIRTLVKANVFQKLAAMVEAVPTMVMATPVLIMGEVFGDVQDLKYGGGAAFRAFDFATGYRRDRRWFARPAAFDLFKDAGIEAVPVLYCGPFSKAVLDEYTNGTETVSGKALHIREGVVVVPTDGRTLKDHPDLTNGGRVILKSVSAAYLLRKGDATEYN